MFSQDRIAETLNNVDNFLQGKTAGPLLSLWHEPTYRQKQNAEEIIAEACAVIRQDSASNEPNILPCFVPDFGTVSTAKIYGGTEIPARNGAGVHIEPIAQTVHDLLELEPVPFEETDFQRAIDLYRRICERLQTDNIFIRTPDFQGPLNTLSLLLDQTTLMMSMYDDPETVHTLLDRITDDLIDCVTRFRQELGPDKVIGNIWPYVILPHGKGIALTQDYMPLLGAEQYAEFEIPRLQRIADSFGGVWIHCCGRYGQHLNALAESGIKIWGLELHEPLTKLSEVFAVFGSEIAYLPYLMAQQANEYQDLVGLLKAHLQNPEFARRIWMVGCREWDGAEELTSLLRQ